MSKVKLSEKELRRVISTILAEAAALDPMKKPAGGKTPAAVPGTSTPAPTSTDKPKQAGLFTMTFKELEDSKQSDPMDPSLVKLVDKIAKTGWQDKFKNLTGNTVSQNYNILNIVSNLNTLKSFPNDVLQKIAQLLLTGEKITLKDPGAGSDIVFEPVADAPAIIIKDANTIYTQLDKITQEEKDVIAVALGSNVVYQGYESMFSDPTFVSLVAENINAPDAKPGGKAAGFTYIPKDQKFSKLEEALDGFIRDLNLNLESFRDALKEVTSDNFDDNFLLSLSPISWIGVPPVDGKNATPYSQLHRVYTEFYGVSAYGLAGAMAMGARYYLYSKGATAGATSIQSQPMFESVRRHQVLLPESKIRMLIRRVLIEKLLSEAPKLPGTVGTTEPAAAKVGIMQASDIVKNDKAESLSLGLRAQRAKTYVSPEATAALKDDLEKSTKKLGFGDNVREIRYMADVKSAVAAIENSVLRSITPKLPNELIEDFARQAMAAAGRPPADADVFSTMIEAARTDNLESAFVTDKSSGGAESLMLLTDKLNQRMAGKEKAIAAIARGADQLDKPDVISRVLASNEDEISAIRATATKQIRDALNESFKRQGQPYTIKVDASGKNYLETDLGGGKFATEYDNIEFLVGLNSGSYADDLLKDSLRSLTADAIGIAKVFEGNGNFNTLVWMRETGDITPDTGLFTKIATGMGKGDLVGSERYYLQRLSNLEDQAKSAATTTSGVVKPPKVKTPTWLRVKDKLLLGASGVVPRFANRWLGGAAIDKRISDWGFDLMKIAGATKNVPMRKKMLEFIAGVATLAGRSGMASSYLVNGTALFILYMAGVSSNREEEDYLTTMYNILKAHLVPLPGFHTMNPIVETLVMRAYQRFTEIDPSTFADLALAVNGRFGATGIIEYFKTLKDAPLMSESAFLSTFVVGDSTVAAAVAQKAADAVATGNPLELEKASTGQGNNASKDYYKNLEVEKSLACEQIVNFFEAADLAGSTGQTPGPAPAVKPPNDFKNLPVFLPTLETVFAKWFSLFAQGQAEMISLLSAPGVVISSVDEEDYARRGQVGAAGTKGAESTLPGQLSAGDIQDRISDLKREKDERTPVEKASQDAIIKRRLEDFAKAQGDQEAAAAAFQKLGIEPEEFDINLSTLTYGQTPD